MNTTLLYEVDLAVFLKLHTQLKITSLTLSLASQATRTLIHWPVKRNCVVLNQRRFDIFMMSTSIQPYVSPEPCFDHLWVEQIILDLANEFEIRVSWDRETALYTGAFAVAGGLVGGYAGGRLGAVLGAGIGAATGLAYVSLREIWSTLREKLKELIFVVFNYLRRLDPVDYVRATEVLMACMRSRRELVYTILEFLGDKLGRHVVSSITAA